jgi:hypothetical protein
LLRVENLIRVLDCFIPSKVVVGKIPKGFVIGCIKNAIVLLVIGVINVIGVISCWKDKKTNLLVIGYKFLITKCGYS